MGFIILAITVGLALGFFSFYHLELFLAGCVVVAFASGLVLRLLTLFSPIVASTLSPTGESQGYVLDYLNMLKTAFQLLPESAQLGLIMLPAIVIIGRVLTWAHYVLFPDHAFPLTEAERREATLQKFSFKRQGY